MIVMTTPENENWNSRLCVSEQGNGRRTVTWNIGVSPMKFNVSSWLTKKWYKKYLGEDAYTTCGFKESYTISSQFFEIKAERE